MLGILWSVLNPLLFMVITSIIFSTIFKNQIPNFAIYFLCGQIIFSFFSESTIKAQSGIIENGALIKKIYLPKYIFPLSKVCFSFVNTLFSLIAILIIILVTGYKLPAVSFLFFVPIGYVFIFSIGVGLFLSSFTVFYRDTLHLYTIFLTLMSYFSAIFYPIDIIPKSFQGFIEYNPIYIFITYFRDLILIGQIPDLNTNLLCIAYCAVSIIVGYIFFKRTENKLVLFI